MTYFVWYDCGRCMDGSHQYGYDTFLSLDEARRFATNFLRENAAEQPEVVIIRGEEVQPFPEEVPA